MARATFFDDSGNRVPADHCARPVGRRQPVPGQRPRFDADQRHRPAAETGVLDDGHLRLGHLRPAFERRAVVVDRRRPSAVRMSNGFLRSGLASAEKMSPTVRKSIPSTTWGSEPRPHPSDPQSPRAAAGARPALGSLVRSAGGAIARRRQRGRQYWASRSGPMTARSHRCRIVLGGHAAEYSITSCRQHDRVVGRHDEDALGVHSIVASVFQYGWAPTFIPATTTSTSPALGVFHQPPQHPGHPVEVSLPDHGDLGVCRRANIRSARRVRRRG